VCKNKSNSICISTALVSPEPVSPNLSTSSAMKTPGNTKEELDDLETADERDIQTEYSSD